MPVTLVDKQKFFSKKIALLLVFLFDEGYEVTFGEAWRPEITAEAYAKQGKGIANSLHPLRLAFDINLWKDGKYLTRTPDYEKAGVYWESLSTPEIKCTWGGRFQKGDGNHFSVEHNGVR